MTADQVSFTTIGHDNTHYIVDARDWAGTFRLCLTCIRERTDIPEVRR